MKSILLIGGLIIFFEIVLFVSLIDSSNFKINDVRPNQDIVSFFKGDNQILSISEENYSSVKWYLNGKFIKSKDNFFRLENLDSKIHIIRVDVINEGDVDSKTWNVIIKEKQIIKESGLDKSGIVYYVYISVLLIVIFLVLRLFILEKKRHPKIH